MGAPKEIQLSIIEDYKNGLKPSEILKKYNVSKRMMCRILKAHDWLSTGNKWFKPSLDHKTPLSRGGSNELNNFNIITWFENQTKLDKTQEEWDLIKSNILDYFM